MWFDAAESGKAGLTVPQAYEWLQRTIADSSSLRVLPYDDPSEMLFQEWRTQRIRVGTHDMRIAAICISKDATLISRNRQDFSQIPGLKVEYWG